MQHQQIAPLLSQVLQVVLALADKKGVWKQVATDMKLPNLQCFYEHLSLAQTPQYLELLIVAPGTTIPYVPKGFVEARNYFPVQIFACWEY
ncbi:MAG: hypothetical protein ACI9C4_002446 [Paraglaciecola sp.]